MSLYEEIGVKILGISPDSVEKHTRFAEKLNLDYPILSDPEHEILEKLGFWKLKKMYGKEYMGVSRSTVLIDQEGKVNKVWENVKVKGHAEEVLNHVRETVESGLSK